MLFEKFKPQIIAHAEEVFPEECVGVIFGGKYVRLENVAAEPEKMFEMSEADELKYVFVDEGQPKAEAFVHSHPDGPLCPSFADMKAHVGSGIPFVFVGHTEETGWDYWEMGDHLLDEPLLERPFRPGAQDCMDLIRSWYWQEWGVYLPNPPRRDDWWAPGPNGEPAENMYADNFQKWGFVQLTADETPEVGDVFFYKLNPGVEGIPARTIENHGGVYVGDGVIYHHLPRRLSSPDPAEAWGRKASRWVRYTGERPQR